MIPNTFIVYPGHVHPDGERVVDANERYEIVEQLGEGVEIAAHNDPRRSMR